MFQIHKCRESPYPSRYISRRMEIRWILSRQYLRGSKVSIFRFAAFSCDLRRVGERQLPSRLRIHKRRQKCLLRMLHLHRHLLNIKPQAIQRSQSRGFGESIRFKCYIQGTEQRRRSPHAEIMTSKSQTREVGFWEEGQELFPRGVVEPKFEESAAVAEHKILD